MYVGVPLAELIKILVSDLASILIVTPAGTIPILAAKAWAVLGVETFG